MSVYRDQFIQIWNSYLLRNHSIRGNSGNKLRTYKVTFDLEPYLLNVQNTSYRIALTRLHVGSHSLAIKVGRFHKPIPLPINDRLCSICQSVEDELHFLCICPRYSTLREDLEYGVSSYLFYTFKCNAFLLQSTHTHIINNLVASCFLCIIPLEFVCMTNKPPWLFWSLKLLYISPAVFLNP